MEPAGDNQRASLISASFYRLFAHVAAPEAAPDILTHSTRFAPKTPRNLPFWRLCLCYFHTHPQRVRMSEVAEQQAFTKSTFQTRDGFGDRNDCCPRATVVKQTQCCARNGPIHPYRRSSRNSLAQ